MKTLNSGSGVYLTCDIANALDAQDAALDAAIDTMSPLSSEMVEFARGYKHALDAVRRAFGIAPRGTAATEPEAQCMIGGTRQGDGSCGALG